MRSLMQHQQQSTATNVSNNNNTANNTTTNNNNNNIGEGLFQMSSPQQQVGASPNNSTLSELLGSGMISPHGLFMGNGQDSLNSLLLQNSNTSNSNHNSNTQHSQVNNMNSNNNPNLCMDSNNMSIEKLLQQVEMLNHQSNIVAPLPPNMNNNPPIHHPHTQQLTINMDTNSVNSACGWKISPPTDTSPNNFTQQLQLLQLLSQQQKHQQQESHVNIGMIDTLSESSILQLLQSSLNNQRMVNNQPMLMNGNVNSLLSNQHVIGSMNHHQSSSDAFSPSSQASIVINPNDYSTLISHSNPQHALNTSSHQMQDLLKPVDFCESQEVHHPFTSPTNSSTKESTTLLQQGSVEEMLGESKFIIMNDNSEMVEDAIEKSKGGKKRAKKTKTTNKKPSKKTKKELHEISITIPQNQVQHVETSPSTILTTSPNSNSGTTTPQNGDASDKKNEKFSRPLLKNETVLCENNKFKNNYFVFSGTPTSAGSKKKIVRAHSIPSSTFSMNNQSGMDSPVCITSGPSIMENNNSNTFIAVQGSNDSSNGSKSPPHQNNDNRWTNFVGTLSDNDRHSLMQALLEAMVKNK